MPELETVLRVLNQRMSDPDFRRMCWSREVFNEGVRLSDLAGKLGVAPPQGAVTDGWKSYLAALPMAINDVLVAIFRYLCRPGHEEILVNFAFDSAYDFAVRVKQSHDTKDTRGGVHVIVEGPYPQDIPK